MSKAAGLDHYLGAVGKNLVCHDLSAGCYILTPSPSVRFPEVKHCRFLHHPCDVRHPRCYPEHCGSWMSTLGSLFPLERPQAQRRPLDVVLCWPGRSSTWSVCHCSSYSSNMDFLGLCGAGVCFSLTPQVLGFSPCLIRE